MLWPTCIPAQVQKIFVTLGTLVLWEQAIITSTKIHTLQLNAEGLTRAKYNLVHHLAEENDANVPLLQETHCMEENKLTIKGFQTID